MLPPIYENVLEEATHGFGKILVKDKMDYERTKNMMRFLNLLTDVEIE
jgi:hypothetical protein